METTMTKTKIERTFKDAEMLRIITALTDAGFPVERVEDNGTLAYMVGDGACEGRFVTIKVVLTKEFDEETGKGFDIEDGMAEYQRKIDAAATKAKTAAEKAAGKTKKATATKEKKEVTKESKALKTATTATIAPHVDEDIDMADFPLGYKEDEREP